MPVFWSIIGVLSIILLFISVLQKLEINSIIKQIRSIRGQDTNRLVHLKYSVKSSESLINEINELLKEERETKILYQQKKHDLENMLTNISHDLRTPLTSAMGYIDIIKNSDLSREEKAREFYIVEQRLERLEELLNSFFEFSKIISQNKPPDKKMLNLIGILEESMAHYYDDYCCQDREIKFEYDKSRIEFFSNKNMLMRIFDNLIGNAYKHGTGNLLISVTQTDMIRIHFKNDLYDSNLDVSRIFDEFYTTDISRTKGSTGLGLAISKQFAQMLGGNISAEYDGNIFSVILEFSDEENLSA